MAVATEVERLEGIAQLIVNAQLLDRAKMLEHQNDALHYKQPLLQYLIANNMLDAPKTALIIAQHFGLPVIDLDCIDEGTLPMALVHEKLISQHAVIPLYRRGNHLFLGIDDPGRQASLKEIQFHTGLNTSAIVVEADKLIKFINKFRHEKENQRINSFGDNGNELPEFAINEEENHQALDSATEDAPIVKFVNKILRDAIIKGVSDIHFEPYEGEYRIRYRLDGILMKIATPPLNLASRITSRIKVMSNLDIAERRIPQDGRFKMTDPKKRSIDFRVSTCPTTGGEKVVMRILDAASARLSIEALGFSAIQQKQFLDAIKKPQGMILVTGPTGSGKTVSLYTDIPHLIF